MKSVLLFITINIISLSFAQSSIDSGKYSKPANFTSDQNQENMMKLPDIFTMKNGKK